ncbi:MAG: pyruvate dehydrogenase (acetyl-transferring) E1 component subunit alpha [bacterium]|jgi:pyruvate dehydrogenase E1 component alpha subunit
MSDPEILSVLRPDGTADPAHDPGLSDPEMLSLYRHMVLLRAFDEKAVALQRSGRIGFFVPSTGQEACSIGAGHAVCEGDWIFPAYRDHGVGLMRGYPLAAMVGQILGNTSDATRGRQMPNHWCDRAIHLVSVSSPVATQLPHAVGAAYAAKLRGERIAVLTTFGDGGTSTGDFHAAMNFTGVFRLPVVFFCENNRYAISVPVEHQTATGTLAEKARAYGLPGVRVDGNDVLAIRKAVGDAMDRARAGEGGTLIEALTYRMGPHSTSDDPTVYRSDEEVSAWREKDPIRRFAAFLKGRAVLADPAAEEASARETVRKAVETAESAPAVPLSSMFEDVYSEIPWHLAEQRDSLLSGKG